MNTASKLSIGESILVQAKENNQDALNTMFRQFIGEEEEIKFAEYMGQYGIVIMVTHSFICVTNKRIISLQVGAFGEVFYQDAFIESLNSGAIYQPSLLLLYILSVVLIIFTFGIGIVLLPVLVKWYFKIKKCGLVFIIKEGLTVYTFVNRNRMSRANAIWRLTGKLREERIKSIPQIV
jgi:hypothetical protein